MIFTLFKKRSAILLFMIQHVAGFFIIFILTLPQFLSAATCAQKPAPSKPSQLYLAGNKLCWNGKPVTMVGYGTTDLATRDGYDYARFLNTIRFVPNSSPEQRHGVNLTRIWATGTSNSPDCFHTAKLHDPGRPSTTMPFQYLKGESCSEFNPYPKYNMCISDVACNQGVGLNPAYTTRLQSILTEARNNGILVGLVLFDGYFMAKRHDKTFKPLYARNPWNPLNNNLGTKKFRKSPDSNQFGSCNHIYRSKSVLDESGYPFPEFYDICSDTETAATCTETLNCFGLVQKAYVETMVDLVKNNSAGSDHVFFEIMNRIRFDENDSSFDFNKLKRWHDVVGYWIKCRSDGDCRNTKGDYLVAAVIGTADYADLICTNATSCPANTLDILKMPHVDMVNLPAHAWTNSPGAPGPCKTAQIAITRFRKPVIIDTDGTFEDRNDKCQVKRWAAEVASCRINGFPNAGRVHFNHLDGMSFGETNIHKRCDFTGNTNPFNLDFDERYLDCHTLDTIGDAGPTYLSNIVSSPAASSCPHSTDTQGNAIWCSDPCIDP
jgi:hypothetical protein